ncbi:MAG: bactofilin family protein [Minwuia sp.]|uniref:bactofilin family protein n=1 Tax=Minwuia sp. TaxID=2493630 RepID=UPI003A8B7831
MFGRKQPHEEGGGTPDEGGVLPLKKAKPTAFSPELARRREDDGRNKGEAGMTADAKTLVIGREINLKGEIADCERLMVHGSADATLADCKQLTITQSGTLTGTAEVEQAEVEGRFDGEMTVRGRLVIRASGRVHGRISYAEIEIEPGGRIDGEITSIEPEIVRSRAAG